MAIKYFCDHCGKEIACSDVIELDEEDVFWDGENFIGLGAHVCDDCYDLRIQKLIEFDKKFLGLSR